MHSARVTFLGAPLPPAFTPQGPELVGGAHMDNPSGNSVNDIHNHPEAKQLEFKDGGQHDFRHDRVIA